METKPLSEHYDLKSTKLISNWPTLKLAQCPPFNLNEVAKNEPNSLQLLKTWFTRHFDVITNYTLDITENGILVMFNDTGGIELSEAMLNYFFDDQKLGVFVDKVGINQYSFTLRSDTLNKPFPETYKTRREAEHAGFVKSFGYLEASLTSPIKYKTPTPEVKPVVTTESVNAGTPEYSAPTETSPKKEYVIIKANAQPASIDVSQLSFKPYLMPDSFPANDTWIVERNVATGFVSQPFKYTTDIEANRNLNKVAGNAMEWAYTPSK